MGSDSSRIDARNTDITTFQFLLENFSESANRKFTGAVSGILRCNDDAQDARKVHNTRARLAAQQREKIFYAVDDAPEVDSHQPVNFFDRYRFNRAQQPDPGIVNE